MNPYKIEKLCREDYWVVVPREPATKGHLPVISWKGQAENQDIADEELFKDAEHMKEILKLIHKLVHVMKQQLKNNGRRCERVYVATLCETKDFPFHFYLVPRFEGDRRGFAYLFERELEEARWIFDCNEKCETDCRSFFEQKCSNRYDKIVESSGRIVDAECVLRKHKNLICSDKWVRSNEERKNFVRLVKEEMERILE